jgi:hypothetical protein
MKTARSLKKAGMGWVYNTGYDLLEWGIWMEHLSVRHAI